MSTFGDGLTGWAEQQGDDMARGLREGGVASRVLEGVGRARRRRNRVRGATGVATFAAVGAFALAGLPGLKDDVPTPANPVPFSEWPFTLEDFDVPPPALECGQPWVWEEGVTFADEGDGKVPEHREWLVEGIEWPDPAAVPTSTFSLDGLPVGDQAVLDVARRNLTFVSQWGWMPYDRYQEAGVVLVVKNGVIVGNGVFGTSSSNGTLGLDLGEAFDPNLGGWASRALVPGDCESGGAPTGLVDGEYEYHTVIQVREAFEYVNGELRVDDREINYWDVVTHTTGELYATMIDDGDMPITLNVVGLGSPSPSPALSPQE